MSNGFVNTPKGTTGVAMLVNDIVHEYRKAIAEDCIVGVCSLNNCLYPACSSSGKIKVVIAKSEREVLVRHGHSILFDGVSVSIEDAAWHQIAKQGGCSE